MPDERILVGGPTHGESGSPERSAQVRVEMAEVDRVYAARLAEIRKAADLTQVALATQMRVPRTVVSRLQRRHDMLLSTLTGYLNASASVPGSS